VRREHRVLRSLGVALIALAALLVAARLALEPLVARRTHRALEHMHGLWGTFSRVEVSVLHLSYALHDLRIDKVGQGGAREPYLAVKRLESGLYWRELVHGHLVGSLRLDRPKLDILSTAGPSPAERQSGKAPAEAPVDLGRFLQHFVPFRLDRAEVRDGEVLWVNERVPEKPRLWLHGIEATLENFATRAALARGEPSILAASATLQRTGKVSLFASADPLAKGLTFAGQARLQGLALTELGALLAATSGVTPKKGTLDVNVRFKAVDGHLTGGVRPLLRDPEVQQGKPGLGNKLKAMLADLSLDVLSDRVPGRDAVATTIPIEGDVRDPNTKVWPTVLGVVRNAFVAGLANSFANLPPPKGHENESPKEQARRPPATQHGAMGEDGG
jgi:uncharacterized protein YhdP